MLPIITDFPAYSNYNPGLTVSQTKSDNYKKNDLNGKLYTFQELQKSTYSSFNTEKYNFEKKINFKVQEFFNEYVQNLSDLEQTNFDQYKMMTNNILKYIMNSIENLKNFILFEPNFKYLLSFKPEIEIDYDGEISFEWYGRKGARANLTFGRNGELYFVSLFHGESQKARLFNNDSAYKKINDELLRLNNDKIS